MKLVFSSKTPHFPEKRQKNGTPSGNSRRFAIFRSKCRKSIISTSANAHHGTKSRAFFLRKMGETRAKSRHLWGKNGEVF
jgi:hypothetical protein